MKRKKKLFLIGLIVVAVVLGTFGGVALAQTGDENTTQAQVESRNQALLDKIATIYQEKTGDTLDTEALKEAFAQARTAGSGLSSYAKLMTMKSIPPARNRV